MVEYLSHSFIVRDYFEASTKEILIELTEGENNSRSLLVGLRIVDFVFVERPAGKSYWSFYSARISVRDDDP